MDIVVFRVIVFSRDYSGFYLIRFTGGGEDVGMGEVKVVDIIWDCYDRLVSRYRWGFFCWFIEISILSKIKFFKSRIWGGNF